MTGTHTRRGPSAATRSASPPDRILDALCAYWTSDTLLAAIDLGVFTALGRRARTVTELARVCGADRERLRRLCDGLVASGFLRADEGRYRSAADAARYLDARSARTLVGATGFFNEPPVTTAFARLADTIRRRSSGRGPVSNVGLWRRFAATTAELRRHTAIDVAAELRSRGLGRGRVLDIGAGGSPLGLELLRRGRATTLVVQDRAGVVGIALGRAEAEGLAGRVTALPGDAARIPWGGPYDLVTMVNVLDWFPLPARSRLLRKARAALAPGGALAICGPLLDERRTSPPDAVAYDLLLLALGGGGRPSTYRELRQALVAAGFASIRRTRDLPLVLARRRV